MQQIENKVDNAQINLEDGFHNGMLGLQTGKTGNQNLLNLSKEKRIKKITNTKKLKQAEKAVERVEAVEYTHHEVFMKKAGSSISNKCHKIKKAQFQIIYTILFFSACKLNDCRLFTKEDLMVESRNGKLRLIYRKDISPEIAPKEILLEEKGQLALQKLYPQIKMIFDDAGFMFLGNSKRFSNKVFNKDNFIRFVNKDIKTIII